MRKPKRSPILVSEALPEFADELQRLLSREHQDLAAQVPHLRIVDRCPCGQDDCATFHTEPRPRRRHPRGTKGLLLESGIGILVLHVFKRRIVCVEVLDRPEVRQVLDRVSP